jgi:hypothetical protein
MARIGPVKFASGWGFLNEQGEFAVPPIYEELGTLSEDLASFKRRGEIGFLDSEGEEVIGAQFRPIGFLMPYFSEGLCPVLSTESVGYIDRTGTWSIRPQFGVGFDFVKGKAIASTRDHYVVINTCGDVLATLPFNDVRFERQWPSSWDVFVGRVWQAGEEFAVGVNEQGAIVFPPRFPLLTDFYSGAALFAETEWDVTVRYGVVRLDGTIIRPPQFYNAHAFSEGLAKAGRSQTEFGYIDPNGEWVIAPQFRQACSFREGLACVTIKGRQGFINHQGEIVIEPRYRGETSFFNGYAQVRNGGKRAVIDKLGKTVWETDLDP